jgi:hypothetical protein
MELISGNWIPYHPKDDSNAMAHFQSNLIKMTTVTKSWTKLKFKGLEAKLVEVERKLDNLYNHIKK